MVSMPLKLRLYYVIEGNLMNTLLKSISYELIVMYLTLVIQYNLAIIRYKIYGAEFGALKVRAITFFTKKVHMMKVVVSF